MVKLKKPLNPQSFQKAIEDFIKYIMYWEDPNEVELEYGGLKDLSVVLGVLIDPTKIRKLHPPMSKRRTLMDNFHKLLYNYSHKRLSELINVPEIRFLLKKLLKSDYINILIEKNKTLVENKELYKRCAELIISSINQLNN